MSTNNTDPFTKPSIRLEAYLVRRAILNARRSDGIVKAAAKNRDKDNNR